jgi:hypothetical protein
VHNGGDCVVLKLTDDFYCFWSLSTMKKFSQKQGGVFDAHFIQVCNISFITQELELLWSAKQSKQIEVKRKEMLNALVD